LKKLKWFGALCAALMLSLCGPAMAQTANGSGYSVLTYTLTSTKTVVGLPAPAVTFKDGAFLVYSPVYGNASFDNYRAYAAADNVTGSPNNPSAPVVKGGSTSGVVKTAQATAWFMNATATTAVRLDNNVNKRLVTISTQTGATAGVTGDEWDGGASGSFAQWFTLTPYTTISFTFTSTGSAAVDGFTAAASSDWAATYTSVELSTGKRLANGRFSMSGTDSMAYVDSTGQAAGWNGDALLYTSPLFGTVTNNTAVYADGAVQASLAVESTVYKPAPFVPMGLSMMAPVQSVPEPQTWMLMFAGVAFVAGKRRSTKK
jgi:hypothetical protein